MPCHVLEGHSAVSLILSTLNLCDKRTDLKQNYKFIASGSFAGSELHHLVFGPRGTFSCFSYS
jgi:hypothetical protein